MLHGDLWNGDYIIGRNSYNWVISTAVYVSHAKAELAMTELAMAELVDGSFPTVYEAYQENAMVEPNCAGWRDLHESVRPCIYAFGDEEWEPRIDWGIATM